MRYLISDRYYGVAYKGKIVRYHDGIFDDIYSDYESACENMHNAFNCPVIDCELGISCEECKKESAESAQNEIDRLNILADFRDVVREAEQDDELIDLRNADSIKDKINKLEEKKFEYSLKIEKLETELRKLVKLEDNAKAAISRLENKQEDKFPWWDDE